MEIAEVALATSVGVPKMFFWSAFALPV